MKRLGLVILLLALASAQSRETQAPESLIDPALAVQLDALLDARDWIKLGALLTPSDPVSFGKTLPWLNARMQEGRGGMFVPMIFARDISVISQKRNVAPQDIDNLNNDPHITAALASLYTLALISVDGPTCEDKTAPNHRFEQIFQARIGDLQYLKSRPKEVQENVIRVVMTMEQRSAPVRALDDEMCRDGMEEMMAAMKIGPGHEVPSAPGTYGRTISLPDVSGWKPKYNEPEVYKPMQEQARLHLQARLESLLL